MFSKVLSEKPEFKFSPPSKQKDMDFTVRSNSDVMNNFFINTATRSFTDIDEQIYNKFESPEIKKTNETLKEVKKLRSIWEERIVNESDDFFGKVVKQAETN
jgi:hypothetical protein